MSHPSVPDIVIRRLPLYLRCLTLLEQQGQKVVSSKDLGAWVGCNPAQIRRDLSSFGGFGRQGLGYEVSFLRDRLMAILKADRDWCVVLVGAGALGLALVHHQAFELWHYHIVAIFDNDPEKVDWQQIFASNVYLRLMFNPNDGLEVNGGQADFEFAPELTKPPAQPGGLYGGYWIGEWTDLPRP